MAVAAPLAAAQSARLLRLQRLREQRVRSDAAQAAAARETTAAALHATVLRAQEAASATQAATRRRWDAARGAALRHATLHALRDAEHDGQEAIRRHRERVAEATRAHEDATRHARDAQAALAACTTLTARRERLAGDCDARLQRELRARADATAEDDLPPPCDA